MRFEDEIFRRQTENLIEGWEEDFPPWTDVDSPRYVIKDETNATKITKQMPLSREEYVNILAESVMARNNWVEMLQAFLRDPQATFLFCIEYDWFRISFLL